MRSTAAIAWMLVTGVAVSTAPAATWTSQQISATQTPTNWDEDDGRVDGTDVVWESTSANFMPEDVFHYDISTGTRANLTGDANTDWDPSLDGGTAAWARQQPSGGDFEIFTAALGGGGGAAITTNTVNDVQPDISGTNVAWLRDTAGTGSYDVVVHNGATETVVTTAGGCGHVRVSGNHVVWLQGATGGRDIYHYDMSVGGPPTPISAGAAGPYPFPDHIWPEIDGDQVVWIGSEDLPSSPDDWEVFHYDLGTSTLNRVTTNTVNDHGPRVDGLEMVWHEEETGNILHRDLSLPATTLVAAGGGSYPDVSGGIVVWQGVDADGDSEIYLTEDLGTTIVALTNDTDQGGFIPSDIDARIDGDAVVWERYDGAESEIWLAVPEPASLALLAAGGLLALRQRRRRR